MDPSIFKYQALLQSRKWLPTAVVSISLALTLLMRNLLVSRNNEDK